MRKLLFLFGLLTLTTSSAFARGSYSKVNYAQHTLHDTTSTENFSWDMLTRSIASNIVSCAVFIGCGHLLHWLDIKFFNAYFNNLMTTTTWSYLITLLTSGCMSLLITVPVSYLMFKTFGPKPEVAQDQKLYRRY